MRNSLILMLLLTASPALAHVTLVENEAKAGENFPATFRIGHGCGTSPTTALTITLPDGVDAARPKAQAGWTITVTHAPGANGRATSVSWSGGSLPADQYDDFTALLKLPATAGHLAFPALQTCGATSENWNEMPAGGAKLAHPAPILTLTPGATP